MTITNVYIGELGTGDDPLDWGGDFTKSNTPRRLGPFFPPAMGREFFALLHKIEDGSFSGKKVDWGAFAANVTKQEIQDFVEELYAGDRTYSDPSYMPHLFPQLGELRAFIEALPDRRYALVAIEL